MLEATRFRLPYGGGWYFRQDPVLALHAEKKGIVLAWDTPTPGRIFGIYQDYPKTELMQRLLRLPCQQRNCYELIPKTEMCVGYLVLKWTGLLDPNHSVLEAALGLLRYRCRELLGIDADVGSYCGTTPPMLSDPTSAHHTYHIVVKNLVFQNNHNGQMRAFFDMGMAEINLNVYTRNRQLLLPNCCTLGSTVPLASVESGVTYDFVTVLERTPAQHLFDELRPKDNARWDPTPDPVVPSTTAVSAGRPVKRKAKLVDAPAIPVDAPASPSASPRLAPQMPEGLPAPASPRLAPQMPEGLPAPASPASAPASPAPPKRARVDPGYSERFRAPTRVLEEMLQAAGVQAAFTEPPTTFFVRPGQQQWIFRAAGATLPGKCLKCNVEHPSNAFSVLVYGVNGDYNVAYRCEQGACWTTPDAVLGVVYYDPNLAIWRHQLAHQFPLRRVEPGVHLPFAVELLGQFTGGSTEPHTVDYLTEQQEWRVCVHGDVVVYVQYRQGCFTVFSQLDRAQLGTVWLTSRGTWSVSD
jgi:hypothetical protein